ncbi:SoxR reducing system RseC family protein [Vreelandella rituensis]|uniref:Fis family transcriptional regulator n=1 Tax=Vreelandella rituensis TaxID=2282306 RepID=A0A368TY75_9GAMM|nr:SoxR reducing system RseC family protein [Halomonas rituensis]RCV89316.1 Fis family transcriptional regulator [Halomonas rituensis]
MNCTSPNQPVQESLEPSVGITHCHDSHLMRAAQVVECKRKTVIVEVMGQDGCERCKQGGGCGAGLFIRSQRFRLEVVAPKQLAIGEVVTLALPRKTLSLLAATIYALPLVFALFIAGLGQGLFDAPWVAPVGFFVGLLGGVLGLHYFLKEQRERFRPRLFF